MRAHDPTSNSQYSGINFTNGLLSDKVRDVYLANAHEYLLQKS